VPTLRENEELYRDLVEHSLDLICTHDLDGVLLTVNLAAARTLGYELSELVNRNLRELLSPNVHAELDAYLTALRDKNLARGLIELWTKSGETRIWKYTSTLRTDGVQVPFVRAMAHDITDILHAQKALRESEERLRLAAEVGRMYAWEWDPATDSIEPGCGVWQTLCHQKNRSTEQSIAGFVRTVRCYGWKRVAARHLTRPGKWSGWSA
jgi:PAS domain S-box-containing protein